MQKQTFTNFRPLVTYFALAYLISWLIWLPLYGPAFGLKALPVFPYHHALGGLGPLIASFVTTALYCGKKGLRALVEKCLQLKPLLYLLIALLSHFFIVALAALMSRVIHGTPIDLSGILKVKEFPQFNLLTFFLYNLVFFGFGEEAGWRGFALPRLQFRFNAGVAAVVLSLLWAIWHWPLFLYRPGYTTMTTAGITGWVFSLLTGSILLSWLYNASRGSVVICAVFHATIDIAFTTDIASNNVVQYTGFLITLWGIIILLYHKPKHLASTERVMINDCDSNTLPETDT
jgi:membrane protease YdiL (CAAX protease family)